MAGDYVEKPEIPGVISLRNPDGTPEGAADYVGTASPERDADTSATSDRDDDPHAKRPPFRDRNLAAMKIGSRSPRVYGRVAEAIADDLLQAEPWLADYPEEVAALSSMESVVALLRIEIAARGVRNPDGSLRDALLRRYFSAETAAAKRRDANGLSPIGQAVVARERAATAALTSSAAVDLSTLAARGREARVQRGDIVVGALEEQRREYAAEREAAAAEWREAQADQGDAG